MRLRNSVDTYGALPQSLHWLTVILVALGSGHLRGCAAQGAGTCSGTVRSHLRRTCHPSRPGRAPRLAPWRSPAAARTNDPRCLARSHRSARPHRALCAACCSPDHGDRASIRARRRVATVRADRNSFDVGCRPGIRTFRQGCSRNTRPYARRSGGPSRSRRPRTPLGAPRPHARAHASACKWWPAKCSHEGQRPLLRHRSA